MKGLREITPLDELNEDPASQATLKPKAGSESAGDELQVIAGAVASISRLKDDARKQAHLQQVQDMLTAIWPTGKEIPDVTAERNRASIRGKPVSTEEVDAMLQQLGFSDEALDEASELFYAALEDKYNNDPLRQKLLELLETYFGGSFFTEEKLDVIEVLADKISDLQADLEMVENAKDELMDQIEDLNLQEEVIYSNEESARPTQKKSTVEEFLLEPTEEPEQQEEDWGVVSQYKRFFTGGITT